MLDVLLFFAVTIGATVLFEWLISLPLFKNKDDRKIVAFAQLITASVIGLHFYFLSSFSNGRFALGQFMVVCFFQLIAMIVEYCIYARCMLDKNNGKKLAFVLFANIFTGLLFFLFLSKFEYLLF